MQIVNESGRMVTWFWLKLGDKDREISFQHDDLRAKAKGFLSQVALDANAMFSPEATAGVPAHSSGGCDHFGDSNVGRDRTITYSGTATTGGWAKAETSRQAN